ncbi:annexin a7 [Trichoderma cornu-damae]|uniref:Annexin a7 n=1 Tax=Trichoderma cornu-damae TaxID=654480 RepID=A0A9P8TXL6_9HYPO|nr:annexin a7 [Trichoderma cornu-damae]
MHVDANIPSVGIISVWTPLQRRYIYTPILACFRLRRLYVEMKEKEVEGVAMPLESAPPSDDVATTRMLAPVNPKWSPQDAICAKLFGPWDNLPCYDHINEVGLLRELDKVIVLFEAQIHHSDAGFRAWRQRHKQAMQNGLAEVPGFPCLQVVRGGERIWHDDVWEQRYHYLVHQRQQIIMGRLSRLMALPRFLREDFFGARPAPHRMMLNRRGKGRYNRPLGLRCNWWKPVDCLLEKAAEKWKMNEAALKARFWTDERAPSVKAQAPEWDNAVEVEGQAAKAEGQAVKVEGRAELSLHKENVGSLEESVGYAANPVSGTLWA